MLPGDDDVFSGLSDEKSMRSDGEMRSHTPSTLARTPNLEALLIALRRRWLFACGLGVPLALLVAYAVWTLVPVAKYQARSMVHISPVAESILGPTVPQSNVQFIDFQKTQVALVRSQIVVEGVISDPQVVALRSVSEQESPKEWLLVKLEADFKQGPEILALSIKGDRPDDLVILANAVMRVYLDEFINTEEKRRKARLTQLEKIRDEHKKLLNDKRTELGEVLSKVGPPPARTGGPQDRPNGVPDLKFRQLELANGRLQTIQTEIEVLERKLIEKTQWMKGTAEVLVKPAALEAEISKDSLVDYWQKRIVALQTREVEIRNRYTSREAERKIKEENLQEESATAQKELDKQLAKRRAEATEKLRKQAVEELKAEIALTHEQLKLAESQRAKLATEIATLGKDMKDVGRDSFQLILLTKEVEEEEKLVSAVSADIRTVQLQALAPPRAKPLDHAVVSSLGAEKKKLLFAGGGSFGVLCLVVFGVAWREFSQRKLHSVDEVIRGFGVELVGALPVLPRRTRRFLRAETAEAYTHWTELIDSYRMLLLRSIDPSGARAIMVTSATAGEGKTSLTTHLAVSIARSGRTILLIDSDMRKPTLHRLFGLSRGPGLGEVVRGETTPSEAIRPTGIPGLWVLTAGAMTPTTPDALARDSTRTLFSELRSGFDILLIDSCPVLPVADTLIIAQYVDGVLLSLMRGVSRLPKLSATLHRLRLLGTTVLGAVVNGTDEDVYGSHCYVTLPTEA